MLIYDLGVFYRYKIELELPATDLREIVSSKSKTEALLRELVGRVAVREDFKDPNGSVEVYLGMSRDDAATRIQAMVRRGLLLLKQ